MLGTGPCGRPRGSAVFLKPARAPPLAYIKAPAGRLRRDALSTAPRAAPAAGAARVPQARSLLGGARLGVGRVLELQGVVLQVVGGRAREAGLVVHHHDGRALQEVRLLRAHSICHCQSWSAPRQRARPGLGQVCRKDSARRGCTAEGKCTLWRAERPFNVSTEHHIHTWGISRCRPATHSSEGPLSSSRGALSSACAATLTAQANAHE